MIQYSEYTFTMYIVDIREHDLIRVLGTTTVTKQLPIGDIWIGIQEGDTPEIKKGGLVIERKTIRDLQASIVDGRYREQKQRLLVYCQEKEALPMYIIEGSWFSGTNRIGPQALMKLIARAQCKNKIAVIHTQHLGETAEVVNALHAYFQEDETNFLPETEKALRPVDGLHVHKKANAATPHVFATACLAQCTGVSISMAETIVKKFGNWEELMNATAKEIEVIVQSNGRKIGPVVSKRLYDILHADWRESKEDT